LQALVGVVYVQLFMGNDFLGPVFRDVMIGASLGDAVVPLLEGVIVAIVLTYNKISAQAKHNNYVTV